MSPSRYFLSLLSLHSQESQKDSPYFLDPLPQLLFTTYPIQPTFSLNDSIDNILANIIEDFQIAKLNDIFCSCT